MTRRNLVDGLVEQIRQTNGFDGLSRGTAAPYDHRIITRGINQAAVVVVDRGEIRAGPFGSSYADWYLDVEIYVRHNNDVVAARRDADAYVQNVIGRVLLNPTLGGSAMDAVPTADRVEDERIVFGAVPYLLEVLTVRATEVLSAL